MNPGITHAAASSGNSHCQAAMSAYHVLVPRDTCSPDHPYRLRKPPGFWRPPVPTDAPTAFFSYSRVDSDFALKLAADLKPGQACGWTNSTSTPVRDGIARSNRRWPGLRACC